MIHPNLEGRKIKEVLESLEQDLPEFDRKWIVKIESERQRLLSSNEPLIDGTLEAGLFDNQTIREACEVSKPPAPGLMLYLLTRVIKPKSVIELGTNVGISAGFIGAALKANGQNGKLTTHDVSPYRQRLAKQVHHNLEIDNISYITGLFTDTLKKALGDMGSVDLIFIDGHHQYQPTLDYFEEALKFATKDSVFVFDDIRWTDETKSDGMEKAWLRIQSDDRLGLVVDLSSVGICVRRQETIPLRYVFPLLHVFYD